MCERTQISKLHRQPTLGDTGCVCVCVCVCITNTVINNELNKRFLMVKTYLLIKFNKVKYIFWTLSKLIK